MSKPWLTWFCSITLVVALLAWGVPLARAGASVKASAKTTKAKTSSRTATTTTSSKSTAKKKSSKRSRKTGRRARGQQSIDGARATEIQQALIREKYLDGEPTGVWDERTKEAMARYQADHGWQTKVLPDARALIKLGLGPNHSNLINPDTAAVQTGGISALDRQ